MNFTEKHNLEKSLVEFFDDNSVTFLPGQKNIIESVLSRNNTLGILPTGGGKSLCFQLPIYIGLKPAIVISPLVALMIDQVESLKHRKINADYINNMKSFSDQNKTLKLFINGELDLLYISPERLTDSLFKQGIINSSKRKPVFFIIDEAHCISEWGHDFRPDYLAIPKFLSFFQDKTILALTATASAKTRDEISDLLSICQSNIFHNFFTFRDNLNIIIEHFSNKESKDIQLEKYINELEKPGLIYTNGKELSERLSALYQKKHFKASYYHADLSNNDKKSIQNKFLNKDIELLFCTNAFGMGVDIPFIRFIIHYRVPSSLDQYIQEIGRAGRDGKVSKCILFYLNEDVGIQKRFISTNVPTDNKIRTYIPSLLSSRRKDRVKKLSKFNDDIIESLIIKQLVKHGYLDIIGDLINTLKIENISFNSFDNFIFNDDCELEVRKTAKNLNLSEFDFINYLYDQYLKDEISIISRGNIYSGFKILNDNVTEKDIIKINSHFTDLKMFKNNKLQTFIEYTQLNSTIERQKMINEYFK